jgi:membrane fusion protein, heavy metal efflux system
VQIKVAAYADETFIGRITRVGEMLNPETRTVEVRSVVDNRFGKLKPEMFATISLPGGLKRDSLMVNQTALQEMDGQTVVFVAHSNNRIEKRMIKTARRLGDLVEVIEGLSPGELVVTEGSFQLKSEFSKDKLAEKE